MDTLKLLDTPMGSTGFVELRNETLANSGIIENNIETIIDSMAAMTIVKDGEGRWIDANPYALEVFGLQHTAYHGKTDADLTKFSNSLTTIVEDGKLADEWVWNSEHGVSVSGRRTMTTPDGKALAFAVTKIPTFHEDGRRRQLITIAHDITTEVARNNQLSQSEQMFRSLFDNSPDLIYALNPQGEFILRNAATREHVKEIIGLSYLDVVGQENIPEAKKHFLRSLQGQTETFEMAFRVSRDETRTYSITNMPMHGGGAIVGVFGIAKDVTDKKVAQHRIHELAYLDELTGLPNRRAFLEHFDICVQQATRINLPLSMMMLDLDGFKYVNDTFGHLVGDAVLKIVAHRIRASLDHSIFAARTGGDEFVLLVLGENPREELKSIANRVLGAVREPVLVENSIFHITASIGISSYHNGNTGADLLKQADIALYRAKEQGKNSWWFYHPTMNVETYKQFVLRNDLHGAVQNKELTIHYQPKVSPFSNRIVGAEALVRWEHREWGWVSPNDFIFLAEESGLISQLGLWVLRTACRQNRLWQEAGLPPIPISVNVSGRQLLNEHFVAEVSNVLTETGLEGKWLELEITESTILNNPDFVRTSINQLQALGIKISVDDFGTGYSSLSQLKKYKFDTLKIDKSFIDDATDDPDAAKLITAMINLAHSLGLRVVVEGVETAEQIEFLRKNHCDEVQGYFYSRPVAPAEFSMLLHQRSITPQNANLRTENRRQFYRIQLEYPLIADMTLESIKGKKVAVGSTEVLVEDVGPGGLRFLSNIRLPTSHTIILKFRLVIFEEESTVLGRIVWGDEMREERYRYGVDFDIDDQQRTLLTQRLNQLSIQLRKKPIVPGCRMLVDSTQNFFQDGAKSR